jgi:poly(A) polymerase
VVGSSTNRPLSLSPWLARLQPILAGQQFPVYLVGGAVRDALLERFSHDLDFVVAEQAIPLAFQVADSLGLPAYVLDRERDTGRVVLPDRVTTLDFACFRGEDLRADLRDRDFTINAMALPAAEPIVEKLIDPCNGRADLTRHLIRQTHPLAIADDPIRALRAVRLAVSLRFSLTDETIRAAAGAAALLSQVSAERIRDESLKLLMSLDPPQALDYLYQLALLPVVLPEVAALDGLAQSPPHYEEVLPHTRQVLQWLLVVEHLLRTGEADSRLAAVEAMLADYRPQLLAHLNRQIDGGLDGWALLRLAALFHDVGKAGTQSVEADGRIRFIGHEKEGAALTEERLRACRLSNQAARTVAQIVAGHMRPLYLTQVSQVSRRAVYRFFRDCGPAGLDIGLLSIADHLATYAGPGPEELWQHFLQTANLLFHHYFDRHEETVRPPPLLNGRELMALLDLQPGPEIGRLLALLVEAQAAGELATREEAIRLVRQAAGRHFGGSGTR